MCDVMKKFVLDTSILLLIPERRLNVVEYILDNFSTSEIQILVPPPIVYELSKTKKGRLVLKILEEYRNLIHIGEPKREYADRWILNYVDSEVRNGNIVYVGTTDLKLKKQVKKKGGKVRYLQSQSKFAVD